MRRNEKLTAQQELERRKRIPLRTQKTLSGMIQRRFAELCEVPARPLPAWPPQAISRPQSPPSLPVTPTKVPVDA